MIDLKPVHVEFLKPIFRTYAKIVPPGWGTRYVNHYVRIGVLEPVTLAIPIKINLKNRTYNDVRTGHRLTHEGWRVMAVHCSRVYGEAEVAEGFIRLASPKVCNHEDVIAWCIKNDVCMSRFWSRWWSPWRNGTDERDITVFHVEEEHAVLFKLRWC